MTIETSIDAAEPAADGVSRLVSVLDQAIRSAPSSRPFLAGARSLTYGELARRIERLATVFARMGLGLGDRIMLVSADDEATMTLCIAAITQGLTAVIVDPESSSEELNGFLATVGPSAVFIDEGRRSLIDKALLDDDRVIGVDLDSAAEKRGALARIRARKSASNSPGPSTYPALLTHVPAATTRLALPDDHAVALILFTSGTTLRPKGVELRHGNLFAQFATFRDHYGYDPPSRILNDLPLHHTDGICQGPLIGAFTGATVVRLGKFAVAKIEHLLAAIYRERITHYIAVPTVLALILRHGRELDDAFQTEDFRFIRSSAGYLDESLWTAFERHFNVMVVNSYGLSETVCEAIYCGPSAETRKVGTIGKPVDCQIRLVDDDGQDVAPGEPGEIALRGANIMKGYFGLPEETAAVLRDGWLLTGDLAEVDDDGFVSIVGRKKNLVIRGGVNILPEAVSRCASSAPGVHDAVAFGLPSDEWGERLILCVQPDDGNAATIETVAQHLRGHLAAEKIPNEILFVETLPRGPAGKVLLEDIKQIAVARLEASSVATGDGVEDVVRQIAADMFKVPVDDLTGGSTPESTEGWDSFAHVNFLLAIEAHFDVKLSAREIMSVGSLKDVMSVVSARRTD